MGKEIMNQRQQMGILNHLAMLLKEAEEGGFELPPIDGATIDALQGVTIVAYNIGDVFPATCHDALAGRLPVEAYGTGRGRFGMVTEPRILASACEELAFLINITDTRLKERVCRALARFIRECHRRMGD